MSTLRLVFLLMMFAQNAVAQTSHTIAYQDVTDLRAGRYPIRYTPLGWSRDGDFVYRELVCAMGASEEVDCHAAVIRVGQAEEERTELFRGMLVLGSSDISVATEEDFLRREQDARSRLPPLEPPGPATSPQAFLGEGIRLATMLRSGVRDFEWQGETESLDAEWTVLVANHSGRSRWLSLILPPAPMEISLRARVLRAFASPDGQRVAVVLRVSAGPQCMSYGDGFVVRVFDLATVRSTRSQLSPATSR